MSPGRQATCHDCCVMDLPMGLIAYPFGKNFGIFGTKVSLGLEHISIEKGIGDASKRICISSHPLTLHVAQ